MMNDGYIKKSDAVSTLLTLRKGYRRTEEKCAVGGCILEIQDLSTVDAVEVVRCKDCRWRRQDEVNRNVCGLGDFYCGETDYCSRGAKMDGDGNGSA